MEILKKIPAFLERERKRERERKWVLYTFYIYISADYAMYMIYDTNIYISAGRSTTLPWCHLPRLQALSTALLWYMASRKPLASRPQRARSTCGMLKPPRWIPGMVGREKPPWILWLSLTCYSYNLYHLISPINIHKLWLIMDNHD
jgi:hypothetical protein